MDMESDIASLRERYPRVAIVHYWLITWRGGEQVLEHLLRMFPEADIFTHVYVPAAMKSVVTDRKVTTTFIQKLPFARKFYQRYLPLMPFALEQLNLSEYDLVISSESGPAKGVIVSPDAMHLCYVHSPMRYLWDHYHVYRSMAGALNRLLMPLLFHRLRIWDTVSAARVDRIVANSAFIQRRIEKAWRRSSTVVHPPVSVSDFFTSDEISDSYLWVGQLVPYKRADLAIGAFNALGLPLIVVGNGPMAASLKRMAAPNITFKDRVDFDTLRMLYARCRGFVFTAEEDFGITPIEVMASGRPVLAYGKGGALETVEDGVSGLFFGEQTVESLVEGVRRFEEWLPGFDPQDAIIGAGAFAPDHFRAGILRALA